MSSAVLADFPNTNVSVHSAEAELEKAERQRETMASGYRISQIHVQEAQIKESEDESKLKLLTMQRSSKPEDQRQLEINISQQTLAKDRARLKILQESLTADLAQADSEVAIRKADLENAITARERMLVRSPFDG